MRPAPLAGLILTALALALPHATSADKPTRVEIGKRGKAATAFVDVPGRGTGTAFCVHPSGLFVTNEHVVRGADGEVTLVLNPALPAERVLKARVARADKDLDLALLRAADTADLPSLPLGSVEGVAELADVVACGFPLGRALAPDRKEYPAVSVNAGTVTALRHTGGELRFIQIDVALTYGSSGGPVLDDAGKVIGVVVSGVPGAKGINQAIPVSRLGRFLQAPDVRFAPQAALAPAALGTPLEFQARAVSLVPGSPEPTLKLVLQAGGEAPREFPMTKRGGVWVATAAPSARGVETRLELTARLATGPVTGLAADKVFKVGDRPVRLSGVRQIEFGPKPRVTLADGRTVLEGGVTGLGAVELAVGDQTLRLDLAKASAVGVQSAPAVASVSAAVVASVGGKEVARAGATIRVRDPGGIAPADPSAVVIRPPALTDEKTVRPLPEPFSDVAPGGGGRYLIFHLPRLRKLAVFDVSEARVTKYVPLTEDKVVFAAGLDSIVVGLPQKNVLERWSLTTFEREKAAPPPFKDEINSVVMGHGSNGPVVVNGHFLDPATFRPLPVVDDKGKDASLGGGVRIPSADGTVYGAWNTRYSPDTATTFVLDGGVLKRYEAGGLHHVVPGPDGREVFTARGIASRTLARTDRDDETYGYCLPAVRGDWFLSLTPAEGGKGGGFTVYLRGVRQPVAKLTGADHGLPFDGWDREEFGPWRRVYFVPDAKVIAVLPAGNDRVVLHKFDPDAALEKSGLEYLLVSSRPPAAVRAGETFTYPVVVKSKAGGVAVKLDAGPPGMAVSAAGVVTWRVPADAPAGTEEVILTVRDASGREVFHTFTVRVTR